MAKKQRKSEDNEIVEVCGPLILPDGYHYNSRNPKTRNKDKVNRELIRYKNAPNAGCKYTGQESRDLLDAVMDPRDHGDAYPKHKEYRIGEDVRIDRIARHCGRERDGIERQLDYIFSHYREYGKRKWKGEMLKDIRSRLDPARKPCIRTIYLFKKGLGVRKIRTTGHRETLTREELQELLCLSDGWMNWLYDKYAPHRLEGLYNRKGR